MSAAEHREPGPDAGITWGRSLASAPAYMLPAGPPHFDEAGRLLLPLRESDFAVYETDFEFNGRPFTPKVEHHITLLGSTLAAELAAKPDARESIEAIIAFRSNAGDWRYRLTTDYRLVGKEPPSEDQSIVVMARLAITKSFFAALDRALGRDVERPPLHVTLYTAGDPRGISLPTASALAARRRANLKNVPPLTDEDASPVDENTRDPIRCPWCKTVLDCPHQLAQFDVTFGECRAGYAWEVFGELQELIAARYRHEMLARALRARAVENVGGGSPATEASEDDFWPHQYALTD